MDGLSSAACESGWNRGCSCRAAEPSSWSANAIVRARALAAPVVLDMCCGSGNIGIAIAADVRAVELHSCDIDPVAVQCARRNVTGLNAAVYEGNLFDPLPQRLRGHIDIIVADAPYVPTEQIRLMPPEARLHEARIALDGGTDGLDVHRRLAAQAPLWLVPGGFLLVETSQQQAEQASELFRDNGLSVEVASCDEKVATVVIARMGIGSAER